MNSNLQMHFRAIESYLRNPSAESVYSIEDIQHLQHLLRVSHSFDDLLDVRA